MDRQLLDLNLRRHKLNLETVLLDETASTNTLGFALLGKGKSPPFLIVARRQTAGRGRMERRWESDNANGIWASLVLEGSEAGQACRAVQVLSVAIAESLRAVSGVAAEIKWPNDVLLHGKKAAGILAEAAGTENGLVLGFGINVNHSESDFPAQLSPIATSLRIETGRTFGLEQVLADLLGSFFAWRADPNMFATYRVLCSTPGRACRIKGRRMTATAVLDDGALVVTDENGIDETLYTGTLEYLE